MPTKKKKFIDKKKAITFHLVHRSQKDPLQADETAPKHVLLQSASKETKTDYQKRKEKERQFGVYFDDDYDYLQHLKDVDLVPDWEPVLERVRISNDGYQTEVKETRLKLPSSVFQSAIEEKVGLLNKVTPIKGPRPDWDPDIVAALDDDFNFDDPENELEDDFITIANNVDSDEELTEGREGDDEMENFDDIPSDEAEFQENDDFFDRHNSFIEEETRSRFTNYSLTSSNLPRSEQLQFLDDRFEKLYEQYDDDEIGTLDHEEICGYIQPDSKILTQLAEEYEKKKKKSTLKDIREELSSDEKNYAVEESSSETEEIIKVKENILDCESIISTYSTTSNLPKLITEPKKEGIKLSQKTGVPINVLANRGLTKQQLKKLQKSHVNDGDSSDDNESCEDRCDNQSTVYTRHSTASTVRSKNETPEERRARKALIKKIRKERRAEKKCNKLAFKEEKKRQEKIAQNILHNLQSVKLV
ncbi:protein LTV1 homolog [Centruroides vittatus]|uniref:protein LTV1 homolog n=1 Tax=Centruroides vittatus TaxID=120091 RepID=UPI0035109C25